MDTALPEEERTATTKILETYSVMGIQFHALRSRQSGARRFMSFHALVPDIWTALEGHQMLEKIEADIRKTLPDITVFTHLEPLGDPASFDDTKLDHPG